jgi:sodium-dependent dicarboxylate transporter 2/3/5
MRAHSQQFKKITIGMTAALVIFGASIFFFTATQAALLGVIAFLVLLWTNEGLPLAVVSLLPIIVFPALGVLDTKATAANYAHPIIFLFFGGFLLAIAVEKSGLHHWIADKVLGIFPNTARGIIFSLAVTSGVLSAILSNTTTTLLLIALALSLSEDARMKMRFSLAIAYGASVGGIMTPIGTPPNLILLGVMQDKSIDAIPFVQWIWMVAPLAFLMFIAVGFLLSFGVGSEKIVRETVRSPLERDQKKVLYIIFGLMGLLLINAPIKPYWNGLGLSEPGILLGAGLLLFAPPFGLLDWAEDKAKIPFRIMFLFGAGFSIAKAFSSTGLADQVASYMAQMTTLAPWLLLFAMAALVTFTTEITSNTALVSIMLPIIYAVAEQSGINTTLFMMVATICASYAFMLPIATPPNAIAMSSGAVDVRHMAVYGLFLNMIGIILVVFTAMLYWKAVLS